MTHQTKKTSLKKKTIRAALPTGCLDAFRVASLKAQNNLRYQHGSLALQEDVKIDASAQLYADQLATTNIYEHSKNRDNTGENIFANFTTSQLTLSMCSDFALQCVSYWYNQVNFYNFNTPGYTIQTGYFSQLVWKSSTRVGMGLSAGTYMGFTALYCVSQYQPAGNIPFPQDYKDNVLPLTTVTTVVEVKFKIVELNLVSFFFNLKNKKATPFSSSTSSMADNLPTGCLAAFRLQAIRTHNSYRSRHTSPPLNEDDKLNSDAYAYARQLASAPFKLNLTPSSNRVDTGESLFVTYSSISLTVQMCERNDFFIIILKSIEAP